MVVGANPIYKMKLLAQHDTSTPLADLSLEYHKCASAECNTMQQKNQSKQRKQNFDPSDHSLSLADTNRPAARSRMQTHAGFGKWQTVLRTERMIGCKAFSLAMVGRRAATSKSRESDFTSSSECGAGTSVTSRPLYTPQISTLASAGAE
jgi:hypothetical protein